MMISEKSETPQIPVAIENNPPIPPINPTPVVAVARNPQENKVPERPKLIHLPKLSYLLVAVILVFFSTTAVLGVQYIMTTSESVMTTALDKIIKAKRLTFNISLPGRDNSGPVSLTIDFHKDLDRLSTAKIKVDRVDNDPNLSYEVMILFGKKDVYIQPTISKIDDLEKKLNKAIPGLSSMRSYQILQPVIKSESYLHIDLSQYSTTSAILEKNLATEEQLRELTKRFFLSLDVRTFDHNYQEKSSTYYRIVTGFKKKELEDFINYFKELNLDVKVSDVNQLVRVIDSVEKLDDDLFTFLINNKTGELDSLTVYLPYISPESFSNTSNPNNKTSESSPSVVEAFIPSSFGDLLKNKNVGQKEFIGKLEFTNYKDGPGASIPTDIVEFSKVLQAIQDEILTRNFFSLREKSLRMFDTNAFETKRLWEKGLYEQSLSQAQNLLQYAENDMDNAVARYWIGLSYYMMRKYSEAENEELQSIKLAPNYGAPYSSLSVLTLMKGDSQKAYEYAQKAVSLSPDYAWAHNSLGLSLIAIGKKEEGIVELRKAVSLQPDSFIFQDNLNRALGKSSAGTISINSNSSSPPPNISPSSSNFHSEGQKTIEDGITATINNVQKINNTLQITISFANISSSSKTVVLARIQMRSPTHGSGNKENYGLETINSNEVRQEKLTYDLLPDSPYTWHYLSNSGNDITLGSYSP